MSPRWSALAILLAACSKSAAEGHGSSSAGAGGAHASTSGASAGSGSGGAGGASNQPVIGGDRPVTVYLPPNYDASKPAPLLVLLHGYGASGLVEELYLQLAPTAAAQGYIYALPDGTEDTSGSRFWNATDACCNYDGSTVDDSGYLSGVVKQIQATWAVDPKRVYVVGHSNGGFMGYRMACDHADQIAAMVSLAGAMWEDTTRCDPSATVSVLEIHGDADTEVLFDGGAATPGPGNAAYPGAETSVKDWAVFGGCGLTPDTSAPPLDLDQQIPGAETSVEAYAAGCKAGASAALWHIAGGGHLPDFGPTFRGDLFAFLAAHPKP